MGGRAVPALGDNVTIADGATVTINTSPSVGTLTVGQGTSGTLIFDTTARALTISGNVTIAAGGTSITQAATTATHTLTIGGDLSNAGMFNMSRNGSTLICNVTFNKNGNQTISGAGGTTRFNLLTLNMGTSYVNRLDVTSSNFAAAVGFLSLTNGTLKMSGSFTFANTFFASPTYSVPATGGLWINNPNVSVTGQAGSPTNNGLLRVTTGTFTCGTASGHAMGAETGAVFTIEGGILNFASRLNTANAVTYSQTGGTVNVSTVGNSTNSAPSFGFTSTSSSNSFAMSGGVINLVQASSATTPLDYRVNSPAGIISGGTLNVGTASTATNFTFRISGYAPNVVVDNTTSAKVASLSAELDVYGNTTIAAGATMNLNGFYCLPIGSIFTNNGTLSGTTAASGLYFFGSSAQTYTGSGVVTAPLSSFEVDNAAGLTLTSANQVASARIILYTGNITNANKLTLGNGGTTAGTLQIGSTGTGTAAGSFDVAPTFNLGSGGQILLYLRTTASRTTGPEINPTRIVSSLQYDDNTGGRTLTISGGGVSVSSTLALTNGKITTSSLNLLTVTSTTVAAISGGGIGAYMNGPIARLLPANLIPGSTYKFPVGKGTYNPYELVNPTTTAGGTVTAQAEVFNANSGGGTGTGMSTINTNRYWASSITSGVANLTNATVKLTDASVIATNKIGKSGTQTGAYDSIGGTATVGVSILSNAITTLGFFVIGTPLNDDMQATAFVSPSNGGTKVSGVGFAPQASFTNGGLNTQANVPFATASSTPTQWRFITRPLPSPASRPA